VSGIVGIVVFTPDQIDAVAKIKEGRKL